MHKALAVLAFLLNLVIPGTGTMVVAIFEPMAESISKMQLIVGVVQLITAFWIIGWLVSIYWGFLIVRLAFKEEEPAEGSGAVTVK